MEDTDKRVYAVAIQIVEEQGRASVRDVANRLREIGCPFLGQSVRNSMNRLWYSKMLVQVHDGDRVFWTDPDQMG